MTDPQNPYEAPSSDLLAKQESDAGALLDAPRKLSAGRGLAWIGKAWGYFTQSPLNWVLMILILFALLFLLSLIPVLGPVVTTLIMPALVAGFMLSCRDLDGGKALAVERLFGAFSLPQRNRFFLVGGLYIAATIGVFLVVSLVTMLIMLAVVGVSGLESHLGEAPAPQEISGPAAAVVAVSILIAMLLFIPVVMAFYFAPALIAFHDLRVMNALGLAFRGVLHNILPLLVLAIVMLLLSILAFIPFMLGYLVLGPVAIITFYVGYREIFLEE
jgi:hypothetical protein